jgi:tungstate transport system substrate-binding protein
LPGFWGLRGVVLVVAAVVLGGVLTATLQVAPSSLILATTTSTQDSGLLEFLLPPFETSYGVTVRVVAVGTGQALELGRRGDADVLLVHAPEKERAFVEEGYAAYRLEVMYNHFLLLGPREDPAAVAEVDDVVEAFRRIAAAGARFVSRGDESGTHAKEIEIWAQAGLDPATFGPWYFEAGQGMAATLRMAEELNAYILADESTYAILLPTLSRLVVLVPPSEMLRNQYSVIVVSPSRHPAASFEAADAFARWLVSAEGQDRIAAYVLNGRSLFVPNAGG